MRIIKFSLAALLVASGVLGCGPTVFRGDAKFPGGARACWDRCRSISMEMASFVYVGEYSSACACRPRPVPGAPQAAWTAEDHAAVVAAAVGVESQRRAAEQRTNPAMQHPRHGP